MAAVCFCSVCDAVMQIRTESGAVVFVCSCGERTEGGPWAARLGGADFEGRQIYEQTIENAYGDRTLSRVAVPCGACGTSSLGVLTLGKEQATFLLCDFCRSYRSGPEAGAIAAAAYLAAEEARAAAAEAAAEAEGAAAAGFAGAFGLAP